VYIPDRIYRVRFTVNEKTEQFPVFVCGQYAGVLLGADQLPNGLHLPVRWIHLDREQLHHSPDKFLWDYAYIGSVDFENVVDTRQTRILGLVGLAQP
jgi:hypothetical protein